MRPTCPFTNSVLANLLVSSTTAVNINTRSQSPRLSSLVAPIQKPDIATLYARFSPFPQHPRSAERTLCLHGSRGKPPYFHTGIGTGRPRSYTHDFARAFTHNSMLVFLNKLQQHPARFALIHPFEVLDTVVAIVHVKVSNTTTSVEHSKVAGVDRDDVATR